MDRALGFLAAEPRNTRGPPAWRINWLRYFSFWTSLRAQCSPRCGPDWARGKDHCSASFGPAGAESQRPHRLGAAWAKREGSTVDRMGEKLFLGVVVVPDITASGCQFRGQGASANWRFQSSPLTPCFGSLRLK